RVALTVAVTATLSSIVISPPSATVVANGTQQFTASAKDQFGAALASQPVLTWTTSGRGSISPSGLHPAGPAPGGRCTSPVAFGAGNSASNLIVVALRIGSTTLQTTVSDSRGNTYRLAGAVSQTTDGSRALIYYASNIAGGANTVTVQLNGAATLRFAIHE